MYSAQARDWGVPVTLGPKSHCPWMYFIALSALKVGQAANAMVSAEPCLSAEPPVPLHADKPSIARQKMAAG